MDTEKEKERKKDRRKRRLDGGQKQRWLERKQSAEKETDRLTQQWGVERVVLLVAVGTQDTFDLHIRGHERGWGHLWQKLLPWLLAGPTERAQIQCVGNVDAHVCVGKDKQLEHWSAFLSPVSKLRRPKVDQEDKNLSL